MILGVTEFTAKVSDSSSCAKSYFWILFSDCVRCAHIGTGTKSRLPHPSSVPAILKVLAMNQSSAYWEVL